jgi:hypothetical protein
MCSGPDVNSLEVRMCFLYLQAFSGGYSTAVAMTTPQRIGYCVPDGQTLGQVRTVVLNFAHGSMGRLVLEQPGLTTDFFIYFAMATTYPCR